MPSSNSVIAKSSRKPSAAASGDAPHKPAKPIQKPKTSTKQDDAPYFSSNKAQEAGKGLLAQRRSTRLTSGKSTSAAPDPSTIPSSVIPEASHYSPGGTFNPNYVYILDPIPAIPENARREEGAEKKRRRKAAKPKEMPIEAPGVAPRTRGEDYDPNEPAGGNNVYWSGDEIDRGEFEGFDLRDVGHGTGTRKLEFLESSGQGEEDWEDGSSQQSVTGLLADASREEVQQTSAGHSSRVVADGAGSGEAGSSLRRPSEQGNMTKGGGPAKDKSAVASSSKGSQESSLQEKHKESALQEKHKESSLQAKQQAKDRSDTGATSSRVPRASIKTNGLTSHELGSANARSEVAPLGPSLMAKEGIKQGARKAVSSWTLPLPPQAIQDIPVKPFSKVFPKVPFPVLSQDATNGATRDKARSDTSREEKLKALRFTKKLQTIPEKPETAIGSIGMKAAGMMFESYEPNKFTEKKAKEVIQAAKDEREEGFGAKGKGTRLPPSSPACTSPGRIPAEEKGKGKAISSGSSSSSSSSGKRPRDTCDDDSSKENSVNLTPRPPKRRRAVSSTQKDSPRSSRQGASDLSNAGTDRPMMELTPGRYEQFCRWEEARAREISDKENRDKENQSRSARQGQDGDKEMDRGARRFSKDRSRGRSPRDQGEKAARNRVTGRAHSERGVSRGRRRERESRTNPGRDSREGTVVD
ncbi:hypothetical protein C8J56DRAFT_940571 [Mycena floridula]|nr:hypothetical protein C8J56DRAFT_940571 [Mycena floridula]